MTVSTIPDEEIRFVSVPGTGNADVEVSLRIDDDHPGCVLDSSLVVCPRIPIPRLVPIGILQRTANATLRAGLQHAMRSFRKELEREA